MVVLLFVVRPARRSSPSVGTKARPKILPRSFTPIGEGSRVWKAMTGFGGEIHLRGRGSGENKRVA